MLFMSAWNIEGACTMALPRIQNDHDEFGMLFFECRLGARVPGDIPTSVQFVEEFSSF
jgi:hypothetical protein